MISDFVEAELTRLESKQFEREYDKPVGPAHEFNRVFRAALDEVWLQMVVEVGSETE